MTENSTPTERVSAWIEKYEANSPWADADRIPSSFEDTPLLLSDLKRLLADLEYFRSLPNLAAYEQALRDREELESVRTTLSEDLIYQRKLEDELAALKAERGIEYGILQQFSYPTYSTRLKSVVRTEEAAKDLMKYYDSSSSHVIRQRVRGVEPGPWELTAEQQARMDALDAKLGITHG